MGGGALVLPAMTIGVPGVGVRDEEAKPPSSFTILAAQCSVGVLSSTNRKALCLVSGGWDTIPTLIPRRAKRAISDAEDLSSFTPRRKPNLGLKIRSRSANGGTSLAGLDCRGGGRVLVPAGVDGGKRNRAGGRPASLTACQPTPTITPATPLFTPRKRAGPGQGVHTIPHCTPSCFAMETSV